MCAPSLVQVDTSGVSRSLEFDDHEAVLISAWVRTGAWLRPALTERLELELQEPEAHRGEEGVRTCGCCRLVHTCVYVCVFVCVCLCVSMCVHLCVRADT